MPLLVLIVLTGGVASAKQYAYTPPWDWQLWMHDFMGFFKVPLSTVALVEGLGMAAMATVMLFAM